MTETKIAALILDKASAKGGTRPDKGTIYCRMVEELIADLDRHIGRARHLRIVFDTTPVNV